MRKTRIIVGTVLIALSLVLGACASAATPTPKSEPTPTPTPALKEVELKYDDGTAEGTVSSGNYAFRIYFPPPATPLSINKVKIFAHFQGTGYEEQKVEVAIVSQDFNLLYSVRKAATEFSSVPSWMTIDIPDVQINNDFYVYVYLNAKREGGVYIHYDSSVINQHSEYMTPSGKVAPWPWPSSPKEKTNWMIRVAGTPVVPN